MKYEEKQIEEIEIREMARVFMTASCKGSECENCLFIETVNEAEECCVCLKALYNAGYRKLPKDSVVLSRERYEWLTCCFGKFEEIMNNIKELAHKEMAEKIYDFVERYIMDDAEVELLVKQWFVEQFGVEIKE